MPLVEIRDFNVLIENNHFWINRKKRIENLPKYQEMLNIEQRAY